MDEAIRLADSNDITYIHIAAHGGEKGVIEFEKEAPLYPVKDIIEKISKIQGRVCLFIDSCFSGGYAVDITEEMGLDKSRYSILTNGGY